MNTMHDKLWRPTPYDMARVVYAYELDRGISKLHENSQAGIIRWEKWNREMFEKKLVKYFKRKLDVKIDTQLVYKEVIAKYPNVFVQQDFMKETYGYIYYHKSGYYKDYGNVIFYARPTSDRKYDFEEFFDYWIFNILSPKYIKWAKKGWLGRKELSQRWYPLRDVVLHYDDILSKEDAKDMLAKCLKARKIKVKEITDYEIIF